MSYKARYYGYVDFINDEAARKHLEDFNVLFHAAEIFSNRIDVAGQVDYDEIKLEHILSEIENETKDGEIVFSGEDHLIWRYIFLDGQWMSEDGTVTYNSDFQVTKYKEEFLGRIIDVIQDCLDDPHGDTINGEWYDRVRNELDSIMKAWKVYT